MMIMNYFKGLFRKDNNCDLTIPRGSFLTLNRVTREEAMKDFTEDDIKNVVMDMAPLKASVPNGLHATFYQNMWSIIGKMVVEIAMRFFKSGMFPKGLNDTIITLIPKIEYLRSRLNLDPLVSVMSTTRLSRK